MIKRPSDERLALSLALLLAGAGTLHFLAPRPYDSIVPRVLPGDPRHYTYASGAAELGCAALVAVPRTRRIGARAAMTLFAAVFPANVQMALDWGRSPSPVKRALAYGRLPLQLPLVVWAWQVQRTADHRGGA